MKKNLQLERLVFFCDAVLAIAITLLVFNLKIDRLSSHLTFTDIIALWPKFAAFSVSFLNVAIFWTIHHHFFSYIKKVDGKLLRYNLYWLFFIVIVPFTASVVSTNFHDSAAIFIYSLNIFFVTFFQNQIWDYVATKPEFLNEEVRPDIVYDNRLSCNVAMLNGLVASGLSLLSPLAAFILLFLRLPLIAVARTIFKPKQ